MEFSSFHDLIGKFTVFQITLTDVDAQNLPGWLRPPSNPDLATQLRYLTEVAKYLTTLEEEIAMSEIETFDDENSEDLQTAINPDESLESDEELEDLEDSEDEDEIEDEEPQTIAEILDDANEIAEDENSPESDAADEEVSSDSQPPTHDYSEKDD